MSNSNILQTACSVCSALGCRCTQGAPCLDGAVSILTRGPHTASVPCSMGESIKRKRDLVYLECHIVVFCFGCFASSSPTHLAPESTNLQPQFSRTHSSSYPKVSSEHPSNVSIYDAMRFSHINPAICLVLDSVGTIVPGGIDLLCPLTRVAQCTIYTKTS